MYPTVGLTDKISRVVQKVLMEATKEEIITNNLHSLLQLALRSLKVEINVKLLQEARNRVRILILLHLNDLDSLPDSMAHTTGHGRRCFTRYNCRNSEISKNPGARCLNGVEVIGGEECFEEKGTSFRVIEVDEERPVEKPCSRL